MAMRLLTVMLVLLLAGCGLFQATDISTLGVWRGRADTAYKDQNYAEAIVYYRKLTEAVPADAENWFRLGNCYARLQDTEAAVTAYRESLVRDRYYAKAWYNIGFNQLRDAQRTFSDATDNMPVNSPMYPIMKSYNEKLLQLIDEQNNAVEMLNNNVKPAVVDPTSVKVIVLDDKKPKPTKPISAPIVDTQSVDAPQPVADHDQPAK